MRAGGPRGHIIGLDPREANAIFIGILIAIAASGVAAATAQAPPQQPATVAQRLAPLAFLLGQWEALPDGSGSRGSCTFALSLQDRVIVRTNHAEAPAVGGRPASVHDDLMVIYEEGNALKADYYDSEAHLIRYAVSVPSANRAVFVAEATAASPGYRLTYWLEKPGIVRGRFEMAAPGAPGVFTTYLLWGMTRR